MSDNKYTQALIIALVTFVLNLIPVAGGCLSCISVIALFLYFSKLHAAEDNDYGVGSGIKFGMIYAVIGTLFSLVISALMGDFLIAQFMEQLEQGAQSGGGAGLDDFIGALEEASWGQIVFYYTLIGAIMSVLTGLILGLVSGLVFSKDEDE